MDETKNLPQSEETDTMGEETSLEEKCPDQLRREFMKRFGSYTAGAAVGMFVLMSARTSAVAASDGTGPDSIDSSSSSSSYSDPPPSSSYSTPPPSKK